MAGLAEILEENARLRELARLDAEKVALQAETIAALTKQVAGLKSSNELFARHFAFLEDRRKMAAAERLEAAERQAPLFDSLEVAAPPRDPEVEKRAGPEGDEAKVDGRKTAKHPRKGRRD